MTTISEAWSAGRTQRRLRPGRQAILTTIVRTLATRLPTWRKTRSTVLTAGGLGALDYAAYGVNHLLGYAAIGVSLLLLEWAARE